MKVIKHSLKIILPFLLFFFLSVLFGCKATTMVTDETSRKGEDPSALSHPDADDLLVVDCLLPGQVRKLGRMVYLSPRRPIKTTALTCRERGGQYVPYSRKNHVSALKVWLPPAQEGDEIAQTEVGEIYEKGLGTEPRYDLATEWYQKAAAKGYPRAQINLGHLYEKGLGVKKDVTIATDWYRKASGLRGAIAIKEVSPTGEAQEFRTDVDLREIKMQTLRHKIAEAQKEMQTDNKYLSQRKEAAEIQRRKLDETRREIEMQKKRIDAEALADLEKLEAEQKKRETELLNQRQEVFKMQQKIESLEAGKHQQIEKVQQELRKEREDLARRNEAFEIEQRKLKETQRELEQKKKTG